MTPPSPGTAAAPWSLKTPPLSSDYQAWRDPEASKLEHGPRNNRVRAIGK